MWLVASFFLFHQINCTVSGEVINYRKNIPIFRWRHRLYRSTNVCMDKIEYCMGFMITFFRKSHAYHLSFYTAFASFSIFVAVLNFHTSC